MKFVFIHGSPAAGKLTVAKAVLQRVPGRLFDNHAAIDYAKNIFDFAAPGFWDLVYSVRLTAIEAAAQYNVPLLVSTFCYSAPEDLPQFEKFEDIVTKNGGQVLPVFLKCSETEITKRISNPDRVERKKIVSEQTLKDFLGKYNIAPVPRSNCLILDSTDVPAIETAQKIIKHFRLDNL
jgi:hypothetical protein